MGPLDRTAWIPRRALFLLSLGILVAGCVGAPIQPAAGVSQSAKRIYVVPMETHPLGVPPGMTSTIGGLGGSLQTARGFGIFNTIAIMLEASSPAAKNDGLSQSMVAALSTKELWSPSAVLGQETRSQLASRGVEATTSSDFRPIPNVTDRSYTLTLENWMGPIRDWYNDSGPVKGYESMNSQGPLLVLEVGLSNYEIAGGQLFVQVHMKLIDPTDGRVVGRTRAANPFDMPKVTPLETTFANSGKEFKEIFATTSRALIRTCLSDLGLARQQ